MENSNTHEKKFVMSLDAGTTSSRAILFDGRGEVVATAQREFRQIFPHPAWVEHDAIEIYETQLAVMQEVLEIAAGGVEATGDSAGAAGGTGATGDSAGAAGGVGATGDSADAAGGVGATGDSAGAAGGTGATGDSAGAAGGAGVTTSIAANVASIGITNQRETTVVWNKRTGMPVCNAIVWQCRRTAPMIEKLYKDGLSDYVRRTTGLVPDAYFSGSKIAWILDNVEGAREAAERGELLFGTIDSWLVWNLTGGGALRERAASGATDSACLAGGGALRERAASGATDSACLAGGAALREKRAAAGGDVASGCDFAASDASLSAATAGGDAAGGCDFVASGLSSCKRAATPVHVTDVTNASRTMLFDIHKLQWDKILLDYFNIPESMLPRVVMSSEIVGYVSGNLLCDAPGAASSPAADEQSDSATAPGFTAVPTTATGGLSNSAALAPSFTAVPTADEILIPIAGIAGDQQAALFGQLCVSPGNIKNTYGTGCFTLMNTGEKPISSSHGLLTTIAYGIDGKVNYALEGSVFIAGAAVQWLRDELNLIDSAAASEDACRAVADTDGVYVVPAFAGIGAPYWNPNARGTIVGITRGTNKNHITRAVVESIAYQVADLIGAMEEDLLAAWGEDLAGTKIESIRVDGGASANDFLMEFQSNILNKSICRSDVLETTALGAAYLAGLATGFWSSLDKIKNTSKTNRHFYPTIDDEERLRLLAGWKRAIRCALAWAED